MLARAVLTSDVRFEGWTTEDWLRFLHLWKARAAPEIEPTRPRGGVVVVHEDGEILKLAHTKRGRLDPALARPPAADGEPLALALRDGDGAALGPLARAQHASWALSLRLGALDEIMERFGARAARGDDFTAQSLLLVSIVRDLIGEGAIATWPQRLRGVPVPTPRVIHRTMDAVLPDGRALVLGLFDGGDLWTAFVARRRGQGFDVIAGPDELRPLLGLLSGDWRRDYRHLASAVEARYAPLGFGCFAEVGTFRALQTDGRAGAWSRAAAVRDVILSPIPPAVGVALGVDAAHYAWQALTVLTGRISPLAALGPLVNNLRSRVGTAAGVDVTGLLGFDPLSLLRKLLQR
jgi:hypothetical protein